MFRSYLKIGVRNLLTKPGYTFVNIFGLSTGLACFMLIGLFIQHELSFDSFHEKSDRIYRVGKKGFTEKFLGTDEWVRTPSPLAQTLVDELPEVEAATNITEAVSFIKKDDLLFEEQGLFAEGNFFEVFSFELLNGDKGSTFEDANSIFLSKTLSEKYFGLQNPIGETIKITHSGSDFSGQLSMTVKGVFRDVPPTSHLSFEFIVPTSSSGELENYLESWQSNSYLTYILLTKNIPKLNLENRIWSVVKKYEEESTQSSNRKIGTYFAQPLSDIHLRSNVNGEFQANGNISYIYLFFAISLIILVLACINYTNLSIARSFLRSKEVGVRKSVGASKSQLIGQFLTESLMLSGISVILALAMVQLFLPYFDSLIDRNISFSVIQQPKSLLLISSLGVTVGLMTGIYPALILSQFNPIKALKGLSISLTGKPLLQKVLVTAQFTATIAFIIGSLVIYKQLSFVQFSSTGLDRNQVLSITVKDKELYSKYDVLKQTLENNAGIKKVSAAQNDPININSSSPANGWEGMDSDESISVYRSAIQHDYISLFGLEIIEGRDFSPEMTTDEQTGIIINETLKKELGWDTAIGKSFTFRGRKGRVTGVVKDFHYLSHHQEIAPLALFLETDWWFPYQKIFIKLDSENIQETISFIEKTMVHFTADYPFEFIFLDDAFQNMYELENRLAKLINYFTILALIIACLGLLGLAAFTISQRIKEIGIRKVLGATTSAILVLLSKDFLKPVLIGFLIAMPIAWYGAREWLTQFAYKTDITLWLFIISGMLTTIIAFLAISWQAFSIARMNPANSLKNE